MRHGPAHDGRHVITRLAHNLSGTLNDRRTPGRAVHVLQRAPAPRRPQGRRTHRLTGGTRAALTRRDACAIHTSSLDRLAARAARTASTCRLRCAHIGEVHRVCGACGRLCARSGCRTGQWNWPQQFNQRRGRRRRHCTCPGSGRAGQLRQLGVSPHAANAHLHRIADCPRRMLASRRQTSAHMAERHGAPHAVKQGARKLQVDSVTAATVCRHDGFCPPSARCIVVVAPHLNLLTLLPNASCTSPGRAGARRQSSGGGRCHRVGGSQSFTPCRAGVRATRRHTMLSWRIE
mmetsp:Transcript_17100/g.39157  ORF Transcript_17100/g.39157 Transcript_17100/m.39157 type:complete len:291 (+) Transcript_17100:2248-3120(+)